MRFLSQVFRAVIVAVLGFVVGVTIYGTTLFMFWRLYPYKTADVQVPVTILNYENEVKAGGEIELLVFFDKYTDVTPDAQRSVICPSGAVYSVTPVETSNSRPRGDDRFAMPVFRLQQNAKPEDNCFFQFTLSYQMNPIRVIVKEWISEPLDIK